MQLTLTEKINNFCLILLASVAVTVALIYTRGILVPFVFAIFIYSILSPLLRWLQARWRFPRVLAILFTALLIVLGAGIFWLLIFHSLSGFFDSADLYRQKILSFIQWAAEFAQHLGFQIDSASLQNTLKALPVFTVAKNLSGALASLVGNVILVVIFTLFMLLGESSTKRAHPFVAEIQNKVARYLTAKFFISLSTGLLVGLTLWFLNVELALMFGALTFLLNFIPNIGSLIATLLPIPVVLLQFGFSWPFYLALGIPLLIQFSIGNVLEPKLMGESMDLHPVTVLLFLMFWGLVWGIPGMFLSVPITAILKIILSRIETTRPIAELLAGRFG